MDAAARGETMDGFWRTLANLTDKQLSRCVSPLERGRSKDELACGFCVVPLRPDGKVVDVGGPSHQQQIQHLSYVCPRFVNAVMNFL